MSRALFTRGLLDAVRPFEYTVIVLLVEILGALRPGHPAVTEFKEIQ